MNITWKQFIDLVNKTVPPELLDTEIADYSIDVSDFLVVPEFATAFDKLVEEAEQKVS